MKKSSKLMRASGILLVLTLITSCFVGGTFAKYVTEKKAADTARVAVWGVEVEATGNAFKTSYDSVTAGNAVVSESGEVVAPGTKGTLGGVKITGKPEVAVSINAIANVELTGWTTNGSDYYCPLVFTIERQYSYFPGGGEPTPRSEIIQEIKGLDYRNVGEFISAVENAIIDAIEPTGSSNIVEAGTDLSKFYLPDGNQTGLSQSGITVSWEWPFEEAEGIEGQQEDTKDTKLANKDSGDLPTITIEMGATVTQID